MALMNLFALIIAVVAVVSANPWAQREAMNKQRKDSNTRRAHSVTKNSRSQVYSPSLRSEKKLETSTTANWVQYALRDSQTCAGDAHYYYWQATNECAEAEYISGYNDVILNYVKVGCMDYGSVTQITNTYYSDVACNSKTTVKITNVTKSCNKQVPGAYDYLNGTIFQSVTNFDQYDMVYGDMLTTSCVTGNMAPWDSVPAPNGQLSMYYEDNLCSTNQIAADLFVSDICTLTDPNAYANSGSGKLTRCSTTDFCGSTWSMFTSSDCSGTPTDTCSWVYSPGFCGAELESSNSVTDNLDVMMDCIGNVSSASSLVLNVASAILMIIASVMSI